MRVHFFLLNCIFVCRWLVLF